MFLLYFIIFIGTKLLIVSKVHNFLFYTLFCRNLHKYRKFTSIWWNSNFPKNMSMQKGFLRRHVSNPNTTSNEIVFNMKVIGNFLVMLTDIKFIQNGVQMWPRCPDLWRVQNQFRDSKSWRHDWHKILPYEISSAKPWLQRLVGALEDSPWRSRGA
jgi:hypothetical protein